LIQLNVRGLFERCVDAAGPRRRNAAKLPGGPAAASARPWPRAGGHRRWAATGGRSFAPSSSASPPWLCGSRCCGSCSATCF